jgi:hypothetical protein
MNRLRATVNVKMTFLYVADIPDGMDAKEMKNEAEEMVSEYLDSKLKESRYIKPIGGVELRAELQHVVPKRRRG